jgi:hypothetical protein
LDSAAVVIYFPFLSAASQAALALLLKAGMKPAAAMMLPHLFLIERDATLWKRQNSDYQEVFIGTAARGRYLCFAMSVRPPSYSDRTQTSSFAAISPLIEIVRSMTGKDFAAEARTLERLGLHGMDAPQIRRVMDEGFS